MSRKVRTTIPLPDETADVTAPRYARRRRDDAVYSEVSESDTDESGEGAAMVRVTDTSSHTKSATPPKPPQHHTDTKDDAVSGGGGGGGGGDTVESNVISRRNALMVIYKILDDIDDGQPTSEIRDKIDSYIRQQEVHIGEQVVSEKEFTLRVIMEGSAEALIELLGKKAFRPNVIDRIVLEHKTMLTSAKYAAVRRSLLHHSVAENFLARRGTATDRAMAKKRVIVKLIKHVPIADIVEDVKYVMTWNWNKTPPSWVFVYMIMFRFLQNKAAVHESRKHVCAIISDAVKKNKGHYPPGIWDSLITVYHNDSPPYIDGSGEHIVPSKMHRAWFYTTIMGIKMPRNIFNDDPVEVNNNTRVFVVG